MWRPWNGSIPTRGVGGDVAAPRAASSTSLIGGTSSTPLSAPRCFFAARLASRFASRFRSRRKACALGARAPLASATLRRPTFNPASLRMLGSIQKALSLRRRLRAPAEAPSVISGAASRSSKASQAWYVSAGRGASAPRRRVAQVLSGRCSCQRSLSFRRRYSLAIGSAHRVEHRKQGYGGEGRSNVPTRNRPSGTPLHRART